MAKQKEKSIDNILTDLYTQAKEFNDKLSVAKEMVKLEMARLKGAEPQDPIPDFYKDTEEKQ